MTIADEVERFARERLDADRRYNDALTALDRAVSAARARPSLGLGEWSSLATTLLVFLQQITAFVESKDREIVTNAGARMSTIERSLAPVAELQTQMRVAQRAIQTLTRPASESGIRDSGFGVPRQSGVGGRELSTEQAPAATSDDFKYVAFEDEFRGSEEAVGERLERYVPVFAGADFVVDLGCGRGELLAALAAAGVRARGVDANADMVAIARGRGLDVVHGEALGFLESVDDQSLGGIVATQVVEHLEPAYLVRLLNVASHKLRRGAPIAVETINAACWLAFFSSYVRDPTHVRPIHPDTLQYLLRASGFERVEIRYSAPVPDHVKMRTVDLPPAIASNADATAAALAAVAHAVNVNAVILNSLMFTHLDYAAVGYRV